MKTAERPDVVSASPSMRPGGFALFTEMIAVGGIVTLLSIPVVTFLPALAAGVGHLRRTATLRADPMSMLWADFRANLRGVWLYAIALPLVLGLLAFNLVVLSIADLPGGVVVRWVSLALGAVVCVVALRAAGRRSREPGETWRTAMRSAARAAREDLRGSARLLVAVGLCAVVVWMLPILLVLVPGMLTMAVVAVESRRRVA